MTLPPRSKNSPTAHERTEWDRAAIDLGLYEAAPEQLAAFDQLLDWITQLTPAERAIAAHVCRQRALDGERRDELKRQAAERRAELKRIKQIEKDTGKRVIALAADGSVTFGEPNEAPSTGLTADDELARWRRTHAR